MQVQEIKIAIVVRLAAATTARDNAEEKVKAWEQRVRDELARLRLAATTAVETDGELDPSPCLHYAGQLEQADRELTAAVNERAARRREVELLDALLAIVKGD